MEVSFCGEASILTDVYAMLDIRETMTMEHVLRAQLEGTRVIGSLTPLIAQIVLQASTLTSRMQACGAIVVVTASTAQTWEIKAFVRFADQVNPRPDVQQRAAAVLQALINLCQRVILAFHALEARLAQ